MCGDATNAEHVSKLFGDVKADLLLTDPPFFTPAQHYQSRVQYQRKFADMTALRVFFERFMENTKPHLKDIASSLVFCNADSFAVFYPVLFNTYGKTSSLLWDKDRIGLGRVFRHQHEMIIWARNSGYYASLYYGDTKARGDVFRVPATLSRDRVHPVEKPVELLKQLMEPLTPAGAVVADLFAGGGGIMLAADQLGRKAYMMELDPAYCKVIIDRYAGTVGGSLSKPERIA